MVASNLSSQSRDKKDFKAGEAKETREPKGKPQANHQNSNTAHNNNNKQQAKQTKGEGVQRESSANKCANGAVAQGQQVLQVWGTRACLPRM